MWIFSVGQADCLTLCEFYDGIIKTRACVYKTLCPQYVLAPNTNLENMYAPIDNVSLI